MSWLDGPFDSQDVLWGVKVYWLVRATGVLQLVSGVFAASDLMSRSRKEAVYKWMASQKNEPEKPKPPLWKAVLKFVLRILLLVGVMSYVVSFCWVFLASGQPWQLTGMGAVFGLSLRVWPYMFVFLSTMALIFGGILAATANGLLMMYHDSVRGFRFMIPKVARFFVPERFDGTVLWISIVLFVLASIAQIVLS